MSKNFTLSISGVICFLTFMISFFNTNYFANYNILKYISLVLIGLYVIRYSYILLLRKFLPVNIMLILFSIFVVLSAYFNLYRGTERNPFLAAIVFSGSLLEMFFIAEIMSEKENTIKMIDIYFKTAIIVTIVTAFIALFLPSFAASNQDAYLIGTKFQVVYMHYLIIVFYLVRCKLLGYRKTNVKIFIILCIWAISASIFTQCSTGIVGIVLLILFSVAIKEDKNILLSNRLFLSVTILSFAFIFIYSLILDNPISEYIIVNLLHRDLTLTSRTTVFSKVLNVLPGNLMWGFGYGSAYELGIRLAGVPNTQNAILNWIWQCGTATTILMVVFIFTVFNYSKKYENCRKSAALKPLYILLYIFIILGSVEVTFNNTFWGLLAALLLVSNRAATLFEY